MKLTRRRFLTTCLAGAGTFAATGAYAGVVGPNDLVVERPRVRVRGLEGMRMVVMSDFHLEPFTKLPLIEEAVTMANALQPDLIVLPGDFITSDVEPIRALAPALGKLQARLGVFASLGNHDYWHHREIILSELEKAGVTVLENRGVNLRYGAQDFFLAGLKSAWASHPVLPEALVGRARRVPTILAMHEPDFADRIAPLGQVDLQVSGHSHGGQVRLPGIGALRLPSWGQRYDCGSYRVGDLQLYTTRGIGMIGVPVRFLCAPEITEITFT